MTEPIKTDPALIDEITNAMQHREVLVEGKQLSNLIAERNMYHHALSRCLVFLKKTNKTGVNNSLVDEIQKVMDKFGTLPTWSKPESPAETETPDDHSPGMGM